MELVEQKLVKWARIALLVKNCQIHVLFYFLKSLICFAFASKPFTVIMLISVQKKEITRTSSDLLSKLHFLQLMFYMVTVLYVVYI